MAEPTPFLEVRWEDRDITASCAAVDVEDHDTLIDKATITLRDPRHTGPPFDEGHKVAVTMGWDGEKALLFSGYLREPDTTMPAAGAASITLTALDPSYKLNRERKDVAHGDVGKLSALVEKVFSAHPEIAKGQVACDPDVEFTGDPVVRQHNLTDWQFLQRLGAVYGHRCFVELNDDAPKYYFISNQKLLTNPSQGTLQYCRGLSQLLEFRYQRVASRAARQRVASGIDPTTGEIVAAPGTPPPRVDPVTVDSARAAELGCADPADRSRYEAGVQAATAATPLPPVTARPVGQASHPGIARTVTINDPTQVLGLRGTGRARGTIKLRAKGKVTIEGIPSWAEGDWYVTKAVHRWRDTSTRERRSSSYMTEFVVTR